MPVLIRLTVSAVIGFVAGRLAAARDIRLLRRESRTLAGLLRVAWHAASHDPLTGLPNRAGATHLFTVRELIGAPTLVVLVDLDGFKAVNDTYSHRVGDELLRIVAQRLAAAAKDHGGAAARLSGDEFLLLLRVSPDPEPIVGTVLHGLAEPATLPGDDGHVVVHPHASAGIAVYTGGTGSLTDALHHADVALFHAKQQPGSCVAYRADMRMPRNATRHGPRRRDHRG